MASCLHLSVCNVYLLEHLTPLRRIGVLELAISNLVYSWLCVCVGMCVCVCAGGYVCVCVCVVYSGLRVHYIYQYKINENSQKGEIPQSWWSYILNFTKSTCTGTYKVILLFWQPTCCFNSYNSATLLVMSSYAELNNLYSHLFASIETHLVYMV